MTKFVYHILIKIGQFNKKDFFDTLAYPAKLWNISNIVLLARETDKQTHTHIGKQKDRKRYQERQVGIQTDGNIDR
jgi:hypothetical protein